MQVIEELLIGNYKIIQDDARYRFTSDSVLLARFLRAKKGNASPISAREAASWACIFMPKTAASSA